MSTPWKLIILALIAQAIFTVYWMGRMMQIQGEHLDITKDLIELQRKTIDIKKFLEET